MDHFYGKSAAKEVFDRLHSLDLEFYELIQQIPYDQFWFRPGLGIRDKSLITIAALIATDKEEQTKIHMRGF